MKQILIITGLILAASIPTFSQRGPRGGFRGGYSTGSLPAANSDAEKRVLAVTRRWRHCSTWKGKGSELR